MTTLTLNSVQVAKLAGVHPARVLRAITKGELPAERIPGPTGQRHTAHIPYEDAQAWATRQIEAREEALKAQEARLAAIEEEAALKATLSPVSTEVALLKEGFLALGRTVAALQDELRALRTDITPTSGTFGDAVRPTVNGFNHGGVQ